MTKSFRELQLLGESRRFKQQSLELIHQLSLSSLSHSTLEKLNNQIATDPFWLMKFKSQNFHIQAFEALMSNEKVGSFLLLLFPLASCLTSEELQEDSPCYSAFIGLIWALLRERGGKEERKEELRTGEFEVQSVAVEVKTKRINAQELNIHYTSAEELIIECSSATELTTQSSSEATYCSSAAQLTSQCTAASEYALQLATKPTTLPPELSNALMHLPHTSTNFKLWCLKHCSIPTAQLFSRLLEEFPHCLLAQQILCNFTATCCTFISPPEHIPQLTEAFCRLEEPSASPLQIAFFINVLEHCAAFRREILVNQSALLHRLFQLTKQPVATRSLVAILLCCFCWEPAFEAGAFFGCSKEHFVVLIEEFVQLSVASGNEKIVHSESLACLLGQLKADSPKST